MFHENGEEDVLFNGQIGNFLGPPPSPSTTDLVPLPQAIVPPPADFESKMQLILQGFAAASTQIQSIVQVQARTHAKVEENSEKLDEVKRNQERMAEAWNMEIKKREHLEMMTDPHYFPFINLNASQQQLSYSGVVFCMHRLRQDYPTVWSALLGIGGDCAETVAVSVDALIYACGLYLGFLLREIDFKKTIEHLNSDSRMYLRNVPMFPTKKVYQWMCLIRNRESGVPIDFTERRTKYHAHVTDKSSPATFYQELVPDTNILVPRAHLKTPEGQSRTHEKHMYLVFDRDFLESRVFGGIESAIRHATENDRADVWVAKVGRPLSPLADKLPWDATLSDSAKNVPFLGALEREVDGPSRTTGSFKRSKKVYFSPLVVRCHHKEEWRIRSKARGKASIVCEYIDAPPMSMFLGLGRPTTNPASSKCVFDGLLYTTNEAALRKRLCLGSSDDWSPSKKRVKY